MTEPEEKRTLHAREILRQVLILEEYVDSSCIKREG